jgi:hypothetical protein
MKSTESTSDDLSRAKVEIAGRLSALGIDVGKDEDADLLRELSEAVERFEDAVESRGGDLMVDEAPRGAIAQPDDADFVLPRHTADESISAYIERLNRATDRVRQHPRR